MEKLVLEVAYRETHPPFWDALISRYRRPMNNGEVSSRKAMLQIHLSDPNVIAY